uniref:Uncharacterized protein n=1 Tax=Arundo donax TaxID=35708 RepID=A0A0A9AE04_ARUDO
MIGSVIKQDQTNIIMFELQSVQKQTSHAITRSGRVWSKVQKREMLFSW